MEEVEADSGPEVLDIGGGELAGDFASLGVSLAQVSANLAASNITAPNALQSASFGPLAAGRDAIVAVCTSPPRSVASLILGEWCIRGYRLNWKPRRFDGPHIFYIIFAFFNSAAKVHNMSLPKKN